MRLFDNKAPGCTFICRPVETTLIGPSASLQPTAVGCRGRINNPVSPDIQVLDLTGWHGTTTEFLPAYARISAAIDAAGKTAAFRRHVTAAEVDDITHALSETP